MDSLSSHTSTGRPLAKRFADIWEQASVPPDVFAFLDGHAEASPQEILEICALDLCRRWPVGAGFPAERYLERFGDNWEPASQVDLIVREFRCRLEQGMEATPETFLVRFPKLAPLMRARLQELAAEVSAKHPLGSLPPTIDAAGRLLGATDVGTGAFPEAVPPSGPLQIGRYRVENVLGAGGFGCVYLGFDADLNRRVALKVPRRFRISEPEDLDAYWREARIVASLDHPAIVPVYDFGRTDDGLCFVVSKYIEGTDLATKAKRTPLTEAASAELVATIADALHVAHLSGVVHRDVKPANILIDVRGRPFLTDFGIALNEDDYGQRSSNLGTLPYMSPEQLRGEGHLVDGRSDIFSLGVVFYELLTGRRPFPPVRLPEAAATEARPPRQVNDLISKELERICLKAMSHRVADRYPTALDMAADLKQYLHANPADGRTAATAISGLSGPHVQVTSGSLGSDSGLRIVPRGIRSFDREDAGFFYELLPGARDREGVPDTVRFWKTRIQAADPAETFRVAVIYGPSGCGKSSFLKAGVLPRLAEDIVTVYVESTPLETETRLLAALRRSCPDLPADLGLADSLTALRRKRRPGRRRVLIVLDQFEQWLHSRRKEEANELIVALRQCDGAQVQCIVSVRDDFWMAVTQFMEELEIRLVAGENLAAIDLFSIRHAKKVLLAIGQAYEALPERYAELSEDQKSFLSKAVAELAQDDHVVPVHLALFSEMFKDRDWTPAALTEVGGAAGVGVTFLEETFNGRTAQPHHRLHQNAARAVLGVLLSDQTSGIRGSMKAYQELLEASGYTQRPKDFDALLRILDSELRLITPTDPEGHQAGDTRTGAEAPRERFYHLTHDYLVPSVHEWLTRKRRETRRGRAELQLEEWAALWQARPTRQSLPSFFEWVNLLFFVPRKSRRRDEARRRFLSAATRFHLARVAAFVVVAGLIIWGIGEQRARSRTQALVDALANASTPDAPRIIESLRNDRERADPMLRGLLQSSEPKSPAHRHAAMALVGRDGTLASPIVDQMLAAPPTDLIALRDTLANTSETGAVRERLWQELGGTQNGADRRFRAGVALAGYDPPTDKPALDRWRPHADFVAQALIAELAANPAHLDVWIDALRPARSVLLPGLKKAFASNELIDRHSAAVVVPLFFGDDPKTFSEFLLDAEARQYGLLRRSFLDSGDQIRPFLVAAFEAPAPPTTAKAAERLRQTKRRANAAVALVDLNDTAPLVQALLQTSDADLQNYTEDRMSQLAIEPDRLFGLLGSANDVLRAAILRSLGGMSPDKIETGVREKIAASAARLFRTDADPGVHSAAQWLLTSWNDQSRVNAAVKEMPQGAPEPGHRWYVDKNGDTMVVFTGPIDSHTGSPPNETERDNSDEGQCVHHINRDFAIASCETTVKQLLAGIPSFQHVKKHDDAPSPDCPVSLIMWNRAGEYCNWLSKQEGIPEDQWCYIYVRTEDEYHAVPDYLHRTGYRLPTEAEWEFACRAGTTSPFSWGNDPDLSNRYAWSNRNSDMQKQPVGRLCPNRFGLFDMHGNVAEWIQESYHEKLPAVADDLEDKTITNKATWNIVRQIIRGSSGRSSAWYLRSANRTPNSIPVVAVTTGFRVARTMPTSRAARVQASK